MTDEQRCGTCRWWEPRLGLLGIAPCLAVEHRDVVARAYGRRAAVGGKDEHATLLTSPDFGCVLWERKGSA